MSSRLSSFLASLRCKVGTPYSKLDCQGLIKDALKDCCYSGYGWIGTNDMWRNYVADKSADWKNCPIGSLLFVVAADGGEPAYYHDGINAKHVGVRISETEYIHSGTKNGVEILPFPGGNWTNSAWLTLIPKEMTVEERTILDRLDTAIYNLKKMREELTQWIP